MLPDDWFFSQPKPQEFLLKTKNNRLGGLYNLIALIEYTLDQSCIKKMERLLYAVDICQKYMTSVEGDVWFTHIHDHYEPIMGKAMERVLQTITQRVLYDLTEFLAFKDSIGLHVVQGELDPSTLYYAEQPYKSKGYVPNKPGSNNIMLNFTDRIVAGISPMSLDMIDRNDYGLIIEAVMIK